MKVGLTLKISSAKAVPDEVGRMKIIKRVEPKSKDRFVQFYCPCCGSRLVTRIYRNKGYYCFVCPVCHEECMVGEEQIAEVDE